MRLFAAILDQVFGDKRMYNDKQLDHIYAIWLYTYGGSQDIKTFKEYTEEYKDDPDKYGNCPCYICQTEEYDIRKN